MDVNIELGEPSELSVPASPPGEKGRKYYPTFTYSHKGESEYEFPSEGEMTIRFKKVNENTSTDEEENSRHSCTFEIHEIVSVEGESPDIRSMPMNHGKDTEDALDALVAAHKASKKESY